MAEGAGDGSGGASGVRPGALTALLQEVAAAPGTLEGAPVSLPAGTIVGRFEILRELGRGGFGVVYEARDRDLGRLVALKLVRPGRVRDEEGMVSREAEAIARLAHPNLVTLHDVGRCEHGPYLVFELLRGKTLDLRIVEGRFPVQEAVGVAAEVARGLAHAHAEGVIHRDLKPANVFVTSKGQVKILDFGMAHAFGRERIIGGTPAYMAPEQWEDEPEDERTDVFALGVMLYRMLTGEHPFPEGNGRWAAEPAVAPRLDIPGAPGLSELIEAMLGRSAKGRPRDGAAVLAALQSIEERFRARSAGGSPPPPAQPGRANLGPRSLRPPVVAVVVLAIAAVGALSWYARGPPDEHRAAVAGAGASPSIAVLPFTDMTPGSDQAYLADGIAEEILNALTGVEGLKVIARSSSFSFKGKEIEPFELGRRLGVSSLLEGSIRRDGSRIRVSAQVVNAADGVRIWSQSYDRDLGEAFALQEEIAREVARALRARLVFGAKPASVVPEAYRQYQIAMQIGRTSARTAEDTLRILRALERAVSLDPSFARAWARLATIGAGAAHPDPDPEARAIAVQRARDAAARAIDLAPDEGDGYSARGFLRMTFDYDWAGAKVDLEKAVQLNPSDGVTIARLALLHGALGQLPEAVRGYERAVELDPLSAGIHSDLADLQIAAGDLEGAVVSARRAIEIAPKHVPAAVKLGTALLLQGQVQQVLEMARHDENEEARSYLAALVSRSVEHDPESVGAADRHLRRFGDQRPVWAAHVAAWVGRKDEAFVWLDRALQGWVLRGNGVGSVRNSPLLRSLHSDPRWAGLMRKMNLPMPAGAPP